MSSSSHPCDQVGGWDGIHQFVNSEYGYGFQDEDIRLGQSLGVMHCVGRGIMMFMVRVGRTTQWFCITCEELVV